MIANIKDSIALRFFIAIVSVLAVGQLTFSLLILYSNFEQQKTDLDNRATAHVKFLSEVIPDNVLSNNFYPLETLMQQTAEEEEFIYSIVLYVDGKSVTNYLNGKNSLVQKAIKYAEDSNTLSRVNYLREESSIIEVESPVIADDVLIGHVRLGYSTSNLDIRIQNSVITTLAWSSILTILLAVLTIFLFNIQIRNPLSNLSTMATQFAEGDLEIRSQSKGNSEISQLQRAFNNMANQIQANISEMNKLSQVASRTKNAVIISDPMGHVEWVNPAFYDITGYTLDEVKGKTPGSLLQGENSDPQIIEYMRQQIRKQEGFNTEVINYHKTGREYWIAIEVRPVFDQNKTLTNFIAIETDITDRKNAEKVLQQSRDELAAYAKELERSNRELQDFAYISSHDLQEPLRKIQAFGSRIESKYSDVLDERGIDYIQRVQNAANRMQTLINDLLDFSRITTKAQVFRDVNLDKSLNGVLSDLEILIKETNADILSSNLPAIDAEPLHMRQLFQNIISNAIKFRHPDRAPIVKIESEIVQNANGDVVMIEISDNGIGFNQKYAEKIFTIFQRLHEKHEYEGTGIGLAVCRRIVEHHNGTITVNSIEDVGTTFIIKLPIKQLAKASST